MPPGARQGIPEGEKQLYFEHPNKNLSVRIVLQDDHVVGFNTMGVRYRHKVCERWIAEKRTIDYVLDNLMEANFDPEFFKKYERQVVGTLKEQLS